MDRCGTRRDVVPPKEVSKSLKNDKKNEKNRKRSIHKHFCFFSIDIVARVGTGIQKIMDSQLSRISPPPPPKKGLPISPSFNKNQAQKATHCDPFLFISCKSSSIQQRQLLYELIFYSILF